MCGDDVQTSRIPHYDDPVAVGQRLHEARGLPVSANASLRRRLQRCVHLPHREGRADSVLQVMRELARRTGVAEAYLARGRETLDGEVALRIREVEKAEADEDARRSAAYTALATAATARQPARR